MTQDLKTTAGIAALMFLRDQFKQQAKDVFEPVEEEMKHLKHKHHDALITRNRLLAKAQEIQDIISLEMQLQHDNDKKVEEAYQYHQPKEENR